MTAAILWSAFWLYGKLFLHLEVLDILVAMLRLVQLMLFQKILIATLEFEVVLNVDELFIIIGLKILAKLIFI